MVYKFERKINYYETDKMGVVHHSNYIRFLEEARCQFLDDIGLPYSTIEDSGIMIPVLGVNCSYKYHVTFNDTLVINLAITEFSGVKMKVNYILTDKKTGATVMIAETKHCFTDKNMKQISLKKHFPDMFEKIEDIVDELK